MLGSMHINYQVWLKFIEMSNKRNSKAPSRAKNLGTPLGPRPFQANIMIPFHLRFTSSSAQASIITAASLCASAGIMAATTTSAYPLLMALKLNKIEMWAPSGAANTSSTVGCSWSTNSTTYVSLQEISDTSCNQARPAHLVAIPPKRSLASDWVQCGVNTQYLATLTFPVGVIVDIHFVGVLADNLLVGTAVTIAGGTVGGITYQPADGDGGVLNPVGKAVAS